MYRVDTSERHKLNAWVRGHQADEEAKVSRRSGILEFAVLGLLRESPMHGYELRKRLNTSLGVFRAFSYGTLYPCLKTLVASGWLIEESGNAPEDALAAPLAGRRAKIVYRLTAEGKDHFEELLAQTGPDAYEDEHFAARFAFFGQTSRDVRMRVLEGRRSRPTTPPRETPLGVSPIDTGSNRNGFGSRSHRRRGQLRRLAGSGRRVLQGRRPGDQGARSDARPVRRLPRAGRRGRRRLRRRREEGRPGPLGRHRREREQHHQA